MPPRRHGEYQLHSNNSTQKIVDQHAALLSTQLLRNGRTQKCMSTKFVNRFI
jgi:hypothetical protein